jgi:HD-like signal output (HDOD) protein
MKTSIPSVEQFRSFPMFQEFTQSQLANIIEKSRLVTISAEKTFYKQNPQLKQHIFLLTGTIKLTQTEKRHHRLSAGDSHAKHPITDGIPIKSASTITECTLLVVDANIVIQNRVTDISAGYDIQELNSEEDLEEASIFYDVMEALKSDELNLPSLPDIAMKIRDAIAQDSSNSKTISRVIISDPAITAKLIKTANSVLYRRGEPISSCEKAVIRLGNKTTTELVTCYALRELFNSSSKLLEKRMKQLWSHSVEIAAVSFVLAKQTPGFDPDHALLTGLVHDIGVLVILALSVDYPDIINNPRHLDHLVKHMRNEIGATVLTKWEFDEGTIVTATHSQDWMRDSQP